jgi:hypothetical protein
MTSLSMLSLPLAKIYWSLRKLFFFQKSIPQSSIIYIYSRTPSKTVLQLFLFLSLVGGLLNIANLTKRDSSTNPSQVTVSELKSPFPSPQH